MTSAILLSRQHDASVFISDDLTTGGKPRMRIPITIREHAGLKRHGEPVVVGIPLPQGVVTGECNWWLRNRSTKKFAPVLVQALAFWPDGSVKWLSVTLLVWMAANDSVDVELCDFDDSDNGNGKVGSSTAESFQNCFQAGDAATSRREFKQALVIWAEGPARRIENSTARFYLHERGSQLVEAAQIDGCDILGENGIRLECLDSRGRSRKVIIDSIAVETVGPVRCDLRFEGRIRRCGGLLVAGKVSVFDSGGLMRIETTLQNPARARHRGGYWDLGDPGSVLLKGWRLSLDLSALHPQAVTWLESGLAQVQRADSGSWRICQYSSGGENWNSRNHVNRLNSVPLQLRGYRCRTSRGEHEGLRASPVVSIEGAQRTITCALAEFWEKFPSAIRFDRDRLLVEFWPDDFGDLHELQAGEHCTRVVWLRFGDAAQNTCRDLGWVREPLVPQVDAPWLAASGAIPWFPTPDAPSQPEPKALLNEALDGPRNLFAKREIIDEYGWRNFGDVWADHEEAYYNGPKPIISHYNNQYDLLYGLLIQYLLTADRRWWELADPLARHVMDIDVYHTSRDKSSYSGGLFWHTAHYLDAATSSHRTHSKRMNSPGGGPANEHAYSAGLLLYYHMTGDRRAKATVLQLADWIITMDDGAQHVLGLLSGAPTGHASSTTEAEYHGPGRGAGNSIGVMLDAWQASGQHRYIDFSEELIRRTVHPQDNIPARELNNFEHRWSYTVYLQHLARYLLLTEGVDRPNGIRGYVAASLLRYADWMVDNDLFYLDYPEQLEFPTETWAAQELRKGNVLFMASQWCSAGLRNRLQRRAAEMMNRAWKTLMAYESRCCTRPIALALQQCYIESYMSRAADRASGMEYVGESPTGQPVRFASQKQTIRNAARSPLAVMSAGLRILQPTLWGNFGRRSWLAEQARRLIAKL